MIFKSKPKQPHDVKYALTVPQSVLFADLSLQGNLKKYFKRTLGISYEPKYISIDNGAMSWNYDSDDVFNKKMKAQENILFAVERFIWSMGYASRALLKVSEALSFHRNNSKQTMIRDLVAYWEAYKLNMPALFLFWNVSAIVTHELEERLEFSKKIDQAVQPNEVNDFIWEQWHLNHIIENKEDSESLNKNIKAHLDAFGFVFMPFNNGKLPSINSQIERVKHLDQSRDEILPKSYLSDKEFRSTGDLEYLIHLSKQLSFWKSERIDVLSCCDKKIQNLYKKVAEMIGISRAYLFSMTSNEILDSLNLGNPVISKRESEVRREGFCLVLTNEKIDFFKPTESKKSSIITQTKVIIGVSASLGSVIGKVRVIKSIEDVDKLKYGEILVTQMTRPEMGIALNKAAAFVTDEGGLLCHASIIAREMKKPCIIATKIATKALQTGDVVDVNAKEGIVKILSGND